MEIVLAPCLPVPLAEDVVLREILQPPIPVGLRTILDHHHLRVVPARLRDRRIVLLDYRVVVQLRKFVDQFLVLPLQVVRTHRLLRAAARTLLSYQLFLAAVFLGPRLSHELSWGRFSDQKIQFRDRFFRATRMLNGVTELLLL